MAVRFLNAQRKRSAKQNGRKCRAQRVSAEAASSTPGRKEEYGDEPDSLIHCGEWRDAGLNQRRMGRLRRHVEEQSFQKRTSYVVKAFSGIRRSFQKGFGQCGSSARTSRAGRDQCGTLDPSVFGGDSTAEPSSRSTILNADSIPVAIRCFWASKSRTSYSMDANKGHVQ